MWKQVPNPEQVMIALVGRVVSDDWSNGRSGTLELKADAISVFESNGNPVIAEAAKRVVADTRSRIAGLHERERRRDASREQTFE